MQSIGITGWFCLSWSGRYDGFHPLLMKQFESQPYLEFDTFLLAVDEFFSKMESQKMDVRAVQQVCI
jgi:hypothetical protein